MQNTSNQAIVGVTDCNRAEVVEGARAVLRDEKHENEVERAVGETSTACSERHKTKNTKEQRTHDVSKEAVNGEGDAVWACRGVAPFGQNSKDCVQGGGRNQAELFGVAGEVVSGDCGW